MGFARVREHVKHTPAAHWRVEIPALVLHGYSVSVYTSGLEESLPSRDADGLDLVVSLGTGTILVCSWDGAPLPQGLGQ